MNLVAVFEKQTRLFWGIVGVILVGLLCIIDFETGYELSFSLFYLAPISLVTWCTTRNLGLTISVVSAIAWVIADITSGHIYSNNAFYLWNTIIRLGFFIIVTFLLSKLKKVLKSERELAHIDYVTGAINARYFYDLAKMEITRTNRYHHPLTLVYIDLDNFKMVNDQFGHHIGNQVLLAVTNNLRQHLRYNDIVARLGGDEFALLLPETDQEAAQDVNSKVQFNLNEEMRKNGWPVTFSIGVITYDKVQCSVDEMIKMADNLMYSVKANGKNGVSYSTCKDFVRISIERPY